VKPQHRRDAEIVLARARGRPGVEVAVWDRRRDPKRVAHDLREVSRSKGDKAKVKAHKNGLVSVIVEG
jgi:hypothetical protein